MTQRDISRAQDRRRRLRVLGSASLSGAIAGTVLVFSAPLWWIGELACNFRPFLGLGCLVPVTLLAIGRAPAVALLSLVLAGVHLGPTLLLHMPANDDESAIASAGGNTIEIVSTNLLSGTADPRRLLSWLQDAEPDVVCLLELRSPWYDALELVADSYPHQFVWPPPGPLREHAFGMAILARRPLRNLEVLTEGCKPRPLLAADLELREGSLRLVLAHPIWAKSSKRLGMRDDCLDRAVEEVRGRGDSIVVGDLNVTAQSPAFQRMLAVGGLRDSRQGFGWLPTWKPTPAFPWSLLAIDHVLVGDDVIVEDRSLGPDLGSDHLPITARLRLS